MENTEKTQLNNDPSIKLQHINLWGKAVYLVSCLVVLYFMYADTLTYLVTKDWDRDGYNYAYLMPFVICYMLWWIRDSIKEKIKVGTIGCLFPVCLGCFFFIFGELGGEFFSLYISFWLICIGIVWSIVGREVLIAAWYPVAMLLTLFPLPNLIYTNLTFQMQLVSSKLGVGLIHLFGMPAFREGNVIDLGFIQLQVVEACSGLHSLISLFVLSLIIIFFVQMRLLNRVLLVSATIPLSIFSNSLRIFLTSLFSKKFGIKFAEGFYHEFSGILVFLVSCVILFAIFALLRKIESRSGSTLNSKKQRIPAGIKQRARNTRSSIFMWLGVVIILMSSAIYITKHEIDPDAISFIPLSGFPLEIDNYKATHRSKLADIYLNSLDLDDYLLIDYQDKENKTYNLYVAFYKQQKKGESIHSPATCLPGSGWEFHRLGKTDIGREKSENGKSKISIARIQKGNLKQLTYYWFSQRGRIMNNAFQLKIYNIIDSITMNRTDGALIRVITPVYENEKERQTEERLVEFVDKIMPLLNRFIPGKDIDNS